MADRLFDADFMAKLEHLAVMTRRAKAGQAKGYRRSKKKGASVEFADYRDYMAGDDLRYVDWNIYGRLERLLIKLFVEEEDLFVHILLDTSESMSFGRPRKSFYAKRLAAALAYISLTRFDRVGIWPFSESLATPLPPVRGRSQAPGVFSYLEGVGDAKGATRTDMCIREFCSRNKRPGVAIIISDLMDGNQAALEGSLKRLRHHEFDVFLLHVLADEEVNPQLTGEFTLVDSETGEEEITSLDATAIAEYRQGLSEYLRGLERMSLRSGVEYARATTTVPFEDLILKYLRQGGMLA